MMNLKVLLPFRIHADAAGVSRIVAETSEGSMGILPQRLDCVVSIVPGILCFENGNQGEVFLAVDEGLLVKIGSQVTVSVRDAIGGDDLEQLRGVVERDFMNLNEGSQKLKAVIVKVEGGFVHHIAEFYHE